MGSVLLFSPLESSARLPAGRVSVVEPLPIQGIGEVGGLFVHRFNGTVVSCGATVADAFGTQRVFSSSRCRGIYFGGRVELGGLVGGSWLIFVDFGHDILRISIRVGCEDCVECWSSVHWIDTPSNSKETGIPGKATDHLYFRRVGSPGYGKGNFQGQKGAALAVCARAGAFNLVAWGACSSL